METVYPSSLKLLLTKHREFIDYMFGAIGTATSSLVRIYAVDCLRLILNLWMEYSASTRFRERRAQREDDEKQSVEVGDDPVGDRQDDGGGGQQGK